MEKIRELKEKITDTLTEKLTDGYFLLKALLFLIVFTVVLVVVICIVVNSGKDIRTLMGILGFMIILILILGIIPTLKCKMEISALIGIMIMITLTVMFLRWVIMKRYRCDPGALTILYAGSIVFSLGLIFYSFGGNFNIFDVIM